MSGVVVRHKYLPRRSGKRSRVCSVCGIRMRVRKGRREWRMDSQTGWTMINIGCSGLGFVRSLTAKPPMSLEARLEQLEDRVATLTWKVDDLRSDSEGR